jgi:hypothetical protein
MRRADPGILEAVAVGALLVGGNQQNVRSCHASPSLKFETGDQRLVSALVPSP